MAFIKTFSIAILCASALVAADLDALIQATVKYEYGQSPAAVRELETMALHSSGTPDAAALEARLIRALTPAATKAGVDAICRALSVVGTDASVPVLATVLATPATSEMARYALERIPGASASKALREAISRAGGSAKAGVVTSLGRRRDAAAVPLIAPLIGSGDAAVATAAAAALGEIGNPSARQALLAAKASPAVADALFRIAERVPPAQAAPIYKRLYSTSEPAAVRAAALRGLARTQGGEPLSVLTAALKDKSPQVQAIAIRELASRPRNPLPGYFATAAVPVKVQILSALADHGDGSLLRTAMASDAAPVRVAALDGLAKLGAAGDIPALARVAARSSGDEQAAARAALWGIRGEEASTAIVAGIPSAEPKLKIELIRAAGERGIRSAPEVLLKTAAETDRNVRRESVRALRQTAGPQHVPGLVALVVGTRDDGDRKECERALAAAIRRSKEAPIAEVVNAYNAAQDPDTRISLLTVMSMVGNPAALAVMREAVRGSDADIRRAAIVSLSDWPSPDPLEDLLALAKSSGNPAQQVLALRGYIKLVEIPANRTPAETAKLLAAAMTAAKRPEEKKAVLAVAQRVVCPESLELARAAVADPAVSAEAKLAVRNLERGLSYRRD